MTETNTLHLLQLNHKTVFLNKTEICLNVKFLSLRFTRQKKVKCFDFNKVITTMI